MPTNTAIRGADTEALQVAMLRLLSSSATEADRIAFIKSHLRAIELCGRRTIQHAWLVGRELLYLKEKRPDLRGRAWAAFLKRHFGLGERQAYDIMRVNRAFPALKALPPGIESVRGAIALLQAKQEVEEAENGATGVSRGCRRSTGYADARADEPRGPSSDAEFYRPSAALPSSARTRGQLRIAQQQLAEIAASDAAAFKQVREVIHQQHARIRARSKGTSNKGQ
jgi:hypothetical protein